MFFRRNKGRSNQIPDPLLLYSPISGLIRYGRGGVRTGFRSGANGEGDVRTAVRPRVEPSVRVDGSDDVSGNACCGGVSDVNGE